MKELKTFWQQNQALLLSLVAFVLALGTVSSKLALGTSLILLVFLLVYYKKAGSQDLLLFLEEQLDRFWQASKTFLSRQLQREKAQAAPQFVESSATDKKEEGVVPQKDEQAISDLGADSGVRVSESDYNKPEESFKLKKRGYGINIFIYIVTLLPVFYLITQLDGSYLSSSDTGLILAVLGGVLLFTYLYLLPTFICHSGAKFFIFFFNFFLGVTIIGWIVLLFWAMSSNKAYDNEQEMKYIMRKMSDRL